MRIIWQSNAKKGRTDGETIHIVAFWDTRREPTKQAQQVKDNPES